MRRAARTDANHADIIAGLEMIGCSVWDTSRLGGGGPDLVASLGRRTVLIEVKDGAKSPSRRKLTPKQVDFWKTWQGEYAIVLSIDDAINCMKKRSAWKRNDNCGSRK